MNDFVMQVEREQWKRLQLRLRDMQQAIGKASRQERAEVAGSVPVYATTGDLPTAGQLGRLAAVQADSGLYFDNGTMWQKATLV